MENNNQETDMYVKSGTIALCTTLVVGFILGRMSANTLVVEAYKDGVSDTLKSMVFTQR